VHAGAGEQVQVGARTEQRVGGLKTARVGVVLRLGWAWRCLHKRMTGTPAALARATLFFFCLQLYTHVELPDDVMLLSFVLVVPGPTSCSVLGWSSPVHVAKQGPSRPSDRRPTAGIDGFICGNKKKIIMNLLSLSINLFCLS
jgi:hypothetical protein